MKAVEKVTKWQCDHCPRIFSNETICREHELMCEHNPESLAFTDRVIGRWFATKSGEIFKVEEYNRECMRFDSWHYMSRSTAFVGMSNGISAETIADAQMLTDEEASKMIDERMKDMTRRMKG